jgi:hypothetical protein
MSIPTQIDVRVIAKSGKYLGDDIGGALVTIYDVRTREVLASGKTSGGSGLKNLMDISVTQAQVLPVADASVFSTTLDLDQPRVAYGPLAAPQAANKVSLRQWVYPGKNITGDANGGGLLLEIPGLVVQILNPPTHFLPGSAPAEIEIRANVTMMCGCPIAAKPWDPSEFEVMALISQGTDYSNELPLKFDSHAQYGAPSQFAGMWKVPANPSAQPDFYEIIVSAFQPTMGNTGVDTVTVIIPSTATTSTNTKQ